MCAVNNKFSLHLRGGSCQQPIYCDHLQCNTVTSTSGVCCMGQFVGIEEGERSFLAIVSNVIFAIYIALYTIQHL